MNYILIFLINFFFSFALYSADIKIINLHSVLDEKVEVNESNSSETLISSFHNNETNGIPMACGRYLFTSLKFNLSYDK